MKKLLSLAFVLSTMSLNFVNGKIVSVSYTKAFAECKEGKALTEKFNKKGSDLRKKVMDFQKEFTEKQTELKKQEKVLTKEAIGEKLKKFEEERKKVSTQLAQEEYKLQEEAKLEYQKYQVSQKSRIDEIRKAKKWDFVLAEESLIASNKDLNRTEEVIRDLNLMYDESSKSTKLAKNTTAKINKSASTRKVSKGRLKKA